MISQECQGESNWCKPTHHCSTSSKWRFTYMTTIEQLKSTKWKSMAMLGYRSVWSQSPHNETNGKKSPVIEIHSTQLIIDVHGIRSRIQKTFKLFLLPISLSRSNAVHSINIISSVGSLSMFVYRVGLASSAFAYQLAVPWCELLVASRFTYAYVALPRAKHWTW